MNFKNKYLVGLIVLILLAGAGFLGYVGYNSDSMATDTDTPVESTDTTEEEVKEEVATPPVTNKQETVQTRETVSCTSTDFGCLAAAAQQSKNGNMTMNICFELFGINLCSNTYLEGKYSSNQDITFTQRVISYTGELSDEVVQQALQKGATQADIDFTNQRFTKIFAPWKGNTKISIFSKNAYIQMINDVQNTGIEAFDKHTGHTIVRDDPDPDVDYNDFGCSEYVDIGGFLMCKTPTS